MRPAILPTALLTMVTAATGCGRSDSPAPQTPPPAPGRTVGYNGEPLEDWVRRLRHGDTEPGRAFAATALGRMGSAAADAVPALVEAAGGDREYTVRENAAEALGLIGVRNEAVEGVLERLLDDPEAGPRREARRALDRLRGHVPTPAKAFSGQAPAVK